MRKMIVGLAIIIITILFASQISAQVLVTGETGGKGGKAIFLSANGLNPEGLSLFNVYGQYVYGLTDRLDIFGTYGNISALGKTQHYVGLGWNINILKRSLVGVDVAFFNVITTPLNKRGDSSTILLTPAVIASRPVVINGKSFGIYSGFNTIVPIGQTSDTIFTPPDTLWSVPIGATMSLSNGWSLYAEFDIGAEIKSAGIGFLKAF